MMKVLFVDILLVGHHLQYLKQLAAPTEYESVAVIPERCEQLQCKQYVVKWQRGSNHIVHLWNRYKWILQVLHIAKKEQVDLIHFLYGDIFYTFNGAGLELLSGYKCMMTLHWLRDGGNGFKRLPKICRKVDDVVVHSSYLREQMEQLGVTNCTDIEYPCFDDVDSDKVRGCDFWKLDKDVPVLACIGSQRFDKGLDILLAALSKVSFPFQLIITGKEDAFSEAYIKEKSQSYQHPVRIHQQRISDEELQRLLEACDIIPLPYRRTFNGASGPLVEGVWHKKCIVGSDHGNLGYNINTHHLGYSFETENIDALTEVLNSALSKSFEPDDVYQAFRKKLDPEAFSAAYCQLYRKIVVKSNE